MPELLETLDTHHKKLAETGELARLRQQRARFEVSALLAEQVRRRLEGLGPGLYQAVLAGEVSVAEIIEEILAPGSPRRVHG